jgi:hypothetical protein
MNILKKPLNETINKLIINKEYKIFFNPSLLFLTLPLPWARVPRYDFFSDKSIIPFIFTLATFRKKYEYEKNEKNFVKRKYNLK